MAGIVIFCFSCGKDNSPSNNDGGIADNGTNKAIIANITDSVIVAGYESLNTEIGGLVTALAVLKSDPTAENLLSAQNAWKAAREHWEAGEGHIFGPVDTLGVDPATDSWPVDTSNLDKALGGWAIGNSVESYANDLKGFHAIEYILFGDGESANTREIGSLVNIQLEYVYALAQSMKNQTETLLKAWNEEYSDTFKALTPSEAVEELLGGMIGIVDEVGNGKIGDPYNDKNTSLVESQFSWNSTTDFTNNIVSVKNIWEAGMDDLINQVEKAKVEDITSKISTAIAKIKAISDKDNDGEIDANELTVAFRNQIKSDEGRLLIQEAIDALAALQASLESLQGRI